jgi:hypothetical protein
MRRILGVLLLIAVFTAGQLVASGQEKKAEAKDKADLDKTIAKIAKYRADGEQKLLDKKFTRKEVMLKGENI